MIAFAKALSSLFRYLDLFGLENKHGSGDCFKAFDEDKQEILRSSMFGLASPFTSNAPHGIWCCPGGSVAHCKPHSSIDNFLDLTNIAMNSSTVHIAENAGLQMLYSTASSEQTWQGQTLPSTF
jgi:hypothetical protein